MILNKLLGYFREKQDTSLEDVVSNPQGLQTIHISKFNGSNISPEVLGYIPSTKKIMVVFRSGNGDSLGSGTTYISENSETKISNIYGNIPCTGEISELSVYYGYTHKDVSDALELKRFFDEHKVLYRNDPPLEKLKQKLDDHTNFLIDLIKL